MADNVVDIVANLQYETDTKAFELIDKAFGKQFSDLTKLEKEYQEYNALMSSTTDKELSKRLALSAAMQKNRQQVEQITIAIGKEFAANEKLAGSVAKVSKQTNNLGFAFSQILREAPAFAFSAQTGLLAISNNIPILLDQLKAARASGQSTTQIFRALGASLFSLSGVMTIVVTALTVLPTIMDSIGDKTDAATKATHRAIEAYTEEEIRLKTLSDEVLNQATTQDRLLQIRDRLVDQYPALKNNLEGEENLQLRLANAINIVTEALKDQAIIKAAQEIIAEATKKRLKGELTTFEIVKTSIVSAFIGIPRAISNAAVDAEQEYQDTFNRLTKVIQDAQERLRVAGFDTFFEFKEDGDNADKLAKKLAEIRDNIRDIARALNSIKGDELIKAGEELEKLDKELNNSIGDLYRGLEPGLRSDSLENVTGSRNPTGFDPKAFRLAIQLQENEIKKADAKRDQEAKDKLKKERKEAAEAAAQQVQIAISALQTIYDAQLAYKDREIALQNERVNRATALAERGNTELLKLETDRLEKAQAERERIAQKQLQLNAILTASQQAMNVANAVGAVIDSAKGDPYLLAFRVVAAAAAIAASVASVSAAVGSANSSFAEGVVDFQGKGTAKSDSNIVRISHGESVITAEATQKYRPILEAMNKNIPLPMAALVMPNVNGYASKSEMKETNKLLHELIDTVGMSGTKVNARVDQDGVAIITERYSRNTRKRWS